MTRRKHKQRTTRRDTNVAARPSAQLPAIRPAPLPAWISPSVLLLAIVVITAIPFLQLRHATFINFDDPQYISDNPYVRQGFTAAGLRWALTTTEMSNWHPLTWASHMLDVELFGMDAGMHHMVSLCIHVINTALLFLVLRRFRLTDIQATLVALLFGVHPLHVESVAWLSERKDVLSTMFLFLAILAYIAYDHHRQPLAYASLIAAFALGLMAKPMLVTFPFLLMLFDIWPLRRLPLDAPAHRGRHRVLSLLRLAIPKVPLLLITLGICAVTVNAQRDALGTVVDYPLLARIENAAVAYVIYLRQMLIPVDLACFYPYTPQRPALAVIAAFALLLSICFLAYRMTTRPYFLVGWLWFIGMLVPVIGLVQIGGQALADRYSYVPLVGVFVALVLAADDAAIRWHYSPIWNYFGFAGFIAICAVSSTRQASYWHDSKRLFEHALAVTSANYLAYLQLGSAYASDGAIGDATRAYQSALAIRPDYAEAHNDLGLMLAKQGNVTAALSEYDAALRLDPAYPAAHYNRGLLFQTTGDSSDAINEYQKAISLKSDYVEAHNNLGVLLLHEGALDQARLHLQYAIRLRPDHIAARINLGAVMSEQGDVTGAIAQYRAALQLDPTSVEAYYNLGNGLLRTGDAIAAKDAYKHALQLRPTYQPAREMLDAIDTHQRLPGS